MKKIDIGSDFSGVGAFEQALNNLKIPYNTVFTCDIDKYARQTYLANNNEPAYFPTDVYKRKIPTKPLDIYMTSPPCQSFSLAGKRQGEKDKRGLLFYNSYEFIKVNKPRYFIFENVKGLLSDDKKDKNSIYGKTFITWLNYLGGKSVNGNPVIFPHENALPYHIYFKVLNSKHYGVPQNRERIFIIGIRNDNKNSFNFPKTIPLTKKLKDVLEKAVDKKFYLSDLAIERICNNTTGFISKPKTEDDIASTIMASDYKIQRGINTLKVKSATKKGYEIGKEGDSINISNINSKTCRGRVGKEVAQTLDTACNQVVINPLKDKTDKGWHFEQCIYDENGIARALKSSGGSGNMPKVISHNIPEIVRVRKHKVNIKELQKCLKKHKNSSNQEIAEKLNITKTTVEHWFRTDSYFSIPDANSWNDLKQLLKIKTTKFDKSITEFEEKEGVFEKTNRCYDENGIAPTLTSTSADERILTHNKVVQLNNSKESNGVQPYKQNRIYDANGIAPVLDTECGRPNFKLQTKIRRLTPLECFRLQGFNDEFVKNAIKSGVSDTQLYKQAGNSITVQVLEAIIKQLKLV